METFRLLPEYKRLIRHICQKGTSLDSKKVKKLVEYCRKHKKELQKIGRHLQDELTKSTEENNNSSKYDPNLLIEVFYNIICNIVNWNIIHNQFVYMMTTALKYKKSSIDIQLQTSRVTKTLLENVDERRTLIFFGLTKEFAILAYTKTLRSTDNQVSANKEMLRC